MEDTPVTIAAVSDVGPDAIALEFETPDGFEARPGQFVKLTLSVDGEDESRFYTLSSPDVDGSFEITVAIDPEGEVGPHLLDLEAGDDVRLSGPFGNAYYEDEDRVVVIAGGPGVGPAIGIAERALADGNEAAVVYRDAAPLHEDRLDAIEANGAFVRVLDADADLTPAVTDALEDGEQVFVYGFADFLSDATDAIAAAGGEPDAAKVENFG
ncbi:FAD-dependent oxidoreductase [Haloarculaceae archaeon H-GB2-1]|nr:FAD-dependent oxidoreductase [Haloarculaceae archaeon H-GB1-1]MEA5387608.1 FAD-dependent oxidoreductase [Haloarculaceae archaeon H-GB11]MEA5409095.1 FAD-dependent oxidoreductase [Haloarculaceae archaeon H-GB2-1]